MSINFSLVRGNIIKKWSVGTTELYNSTKKRQYSFDILKALFVQHSSDYETSDSDRKGNRNIYPDAVKHDRIRLIDPRVANYDVFTIVYLKSS